MAEYTSAKTKNQLKTLSKMKRQNVMVALAAAVFALTSCEQGGNNGTTVADLQGEITSDMTLEAGKTYTLSGGFHVKEGATLTIEEGVTIKSVDDNVVDYILVEQGARIMAEGTAENPIVMTSDLQKAGSWGGLHICGRAPINVTGAKSEIGDASYGGTDANDNSGVLRYIRIEYAGYAFSSEKEANGFTFYGVGAGTTVDHLQAYKGSDDGFEWFGGTVNAKYLVSTDNTDDSFDWTEGWQGKVQYMVAHQQDATCDCLLECDNNDRNPAITPVSHPVLSNLTLVGNNSSENKRGIRLRAGTQAEIYNAFVSGKPTGVSIETEQTDKALADGTSLLEGIVTDGAFADATATDEETGEVTYTATYLLANFTAANKAEASISLTDNIYGTVTEGAVNPSSKDSFFDGANYIGALSADNDWTAGWTK